MKTQFTRIKTYILKHKTIFLLLLSALMILLCSLGILIKKGNVFSEDINFQCARIIGIAQALKGGQFPVLYYPNFYNAAGYVSSLLYPDLFLYFPALLICIGIPAKIAYYFFIYLIQMLIFITMYFFAKKVFKSNFLAVLCASIFVIAQYTYADLFVRAAIGECLGIIFMILLFNGLYNMVQENFSKPLMLSFALLGMLYSHFITLVIGCILVIIITLINAKKLLKQKFFIKKALMAFIVFLFLGSYQIFGFIELYFADTYYISRPWTFLSNNASTLDKIFNGYRYGLGLLMLIPFILRIFVKKDNINEIKIINKLLIISGILILITSAAFPWYLFENSLSFLQFPWRLNTIITILLSFALVFELKNIKYQQLISTLLLLSVCIYCPLFYNLSLLWPGTVNFNDYTGNFSRRIEWLPVSVNYDENWFVDIDKKLYNDKGEQIEYTQQPNTTNVTFICNQADLYYDLPIIYYKGYTATLTLPNNEKQILNIYEQESGRIRVETQHLSGLVELKYSGTTIQHISYIISLTSAICLICYLGYRTTKDWHRRHLETKCREPQLPAN